ncbi:contractile injection system tape measure protein [Flavobacterium sp.]|jgi:hypothetical protein|uniref:contractile injection system tape measure protein n=1 Tax=Flavobacterium sp. TaxID=239 RepID=UPI002A81A427|nr:contractile injection system tape measure protein [Flavobacterium sp.]
MKKILLISILGLLFVDCSNEPKLNEGLLGSQNTEIVVENSGLVILNPYNRALFERLNLLDNNQFISDNENIKAVYCLQYLATGFSQADESLLSLNKVLCGIAPQEYIGGSVEISNEEKAIMDSMIISAISYWPAIGSSSVDGFRQNWLIRSGVLREEEDRWVLTVENRVYDILLDRNPVSFSVIRYPWMPKPLYVNWRS